MGKYILKYQGYGKYRYNPKIESISEKRAEELKSQGYKIFNSRSEAMKHKEKK